MESGQLRYRVTLQSAALTRNDQGQQLRSDWVDEQTLWANVQPATGREYENDRAMTAETTHLVTLRYHPSLAITPEKRFKWLRNDQVRYFAISSAIDFDERNREIRCQCIEVVA